MEAFHETAMNLKFGREYMRTICSVYSKKHRGAVFISFVAPDNLCAGSQRITCVQNMLVGVYSAGFAGFIQLICRIDLQSHFLYNCGVCKLVSFKLQFSTDHTQPGSPFRIRVRETTTTNILAEDPHFEPVPTQLTVLVAEGVQQRPVLDVITVALVRDLTSCTTKIFLMHLRLPVLNISNSDS